jgi:uncharacterized membrane protein YheB (UPF0754 family)
MAPGVKLQIIILERNRYRQVQVAACSLSVSLMCSYTGAVLASISTPCASANAILLDESLWLKGYRCYPMTDYTIYTLPLIAAAIGWLTNYVAIKMLFHPRRPVKLWFVTLQGLFPKRKKEIAQKLGEIVANDLVSVEDLTARLKSDENQAVIRQFLDEKLEHFLQMRFRAMLPRVSMWLSSRALKKIKTILLEEFMQQLPRLVDQIVSKEANAIDIKKIVSEKVEAFSSDQLEAMLHAILSKEFRMIEILGAVLGFFIGCVQLGLVLLA